ncbi:MAG: hypothetical protein ACREME_06660 [Gemmatimonadales bacterium]
MNAVSRRKIEMGMRALEFSRAHPDVDPGYAGAAAKLEQLVARAREGAANQLSGIVDVRAASARKAELRRTMLEVPMAHLAQVGREAAQEDHELGRTFRPKPGKSSYLAFRDVAGIMATEAQAHREVLVRHGLAASVLEEFVQRLEEFDAAMALGNAGRAMHRGATAELNLVAAGIVRAVRVMDGRNRQRFQGDPQLLGQWISASTVLGRPRAAEGTPDEPREGGPGGRAPAPESGDVRPAA